MCNYSRYWNKQSTPQDPCLQLHLALRVPLFQWCCCEWACPWKKEEEEGERGREEKGGEGKGGEGGEEEGERGREEKGRGRGEDGQMTRKIR